MFVVEILEDYVFIRHVKLYSASAWNEKNNIGNDFYTELCKEENSVFTFINVLAWLSKECVHHF